LTLSKTQRKGGTRGSRAGQGIGVKIRARWARLDKSSDIQRIRSGYPTGAYKPMPCSFPGLRKAEAEAPAQPREAAPQFCACERTIQKILDCAGVRQSFPSVACPPCRNASANATPLGVRQQKNPRVFGTATASLKNACFELERRYARNLLWTAFRFSLPFRDIPSWRRRKNSFSSSSVASSMMSYSISKSSNDSATLPGRVRTPQVGRIQRACRSKPM